VYIYISSARYDIFADSNSWIANVTPNLTTERQMLNVMSQLASKNVLTLPRVLFSVRWFKNQISSANFSKYFQFYANREEENGIFQQLQKICREKVFCINDYRQRRIFIFGALGYF